MKKFLRRYRTWRVECFRMLGSFCFSGMREVYWTNGMRKFVKRRTKHKHERIDENKTKSLRTHNYL